jgi:hypothetical protein
MKPLRFQVVFGPADTSALLRHLEGRYSFFRATRIFLWALALICIGFAAGELLRLLSPAHRPGFDPLGSGLAVALLLTFAAVFLIHAHTAYFFSAERITKTSVLPTLGQVMLAPDVREAWIELGSHIVLRFHSVQGKSLAVPVEEALRDTLCRLYPEIGSDIRFSTPLIGRKYRLAIWLSLAGLALASLGIAYVLTVRGVLSW